MVNLRGIPIRLLDTAGLREPRTRSSAKAWRGRKDRWPAADLILHVVDRNAPKPPDFDDQTTGDQIELVLLNKRDLAEHPDWHGHPGLRICCVEEAGLDGLEEAILERISGNHLRPENALAINTRHRDCLRRALEAGDVARASLGNGLAPEYVAVDLRAAARALAEITGDENAEEVLDSLFAQFCIGK